jgi:hypothetical protein
MPHTPISRPGEAEIQVKRVAPVQSARQGVAHHPRVLQEGAKGGERRLRASLGGGGLGAGLLQPEEGGQPDGHAEQGEGPEDGPPAGQLKQHAPQQGRQDGRQAHDEGQEGQHPRRLRMVETVAHDGPGHHPARASAQGLDEPGGDEELGGRSQGAGAGGQDEQGDASQDRPLSTEAVRRRAIEELAEGHARQEGRDRDLGICRIHPQVRADGRKAGEVHVDGHGRKGCEGAQQDHQPPAGSLGSRPAPAHRRHAAFPRAGPCHTPAGSGQDRGSFSRSP